MTSKTGGLRYEDAHLKMDGEAAAAWLDGRLLPMTAKEFSLMVVLIQHSGEVVSRQTLLKDVWGYQAGVKSRTLDVHVRRLRIHLGPFAKLYIETIFSKGYRFQPCADADPKRSNSQGIGTANPDKFCRLNQHVTCAGPQR
jgi:DNA-binding response OmpR family regulator